MLGPAVDPVEMVKTFPFTEEEVRGSRKWAKEVILDPQNRAVMDKFFTKGTGWSPVQLGTLGDTETAMRVCTTLVVLDMAWFSGYDFDPTLKGLWLVVSKDSPLNKRIVTLPDWIEH